MIDGEDRYARHRLIDWWDQDRLAVARVMVLGAGAIGSAVIELLAMTGVGHILIVDFDRVELSNLTRAHLFLQSDVGQSKAEVAARRAREINPQIEIRAIDGDLEFDVGLGIYRAMDVVIGCLDSVNARLAANRACRRTGTPMLNGGIEATLAEIGLYSGDTGPCFECSLPEELWAHHAERFSCTGLRSASPPDRTPTTAVVATVTASYLVNEALYLLHGRPAASKDGLGFGQKLYLTFKPYGFQCVDLPCDARCLAHERWEPVECVPGMPDELTPAGLLSAIAAPNARLELDYDLLTHMSCVRCGAEEIVMQPVQRCAAALSHCSVCNAGTRRPETVNQLSADSEFATWPLARLGVPAHQILAVKHNDRRSFVQLSGLYRF